jgi:uncharacterized protein
MKNILIAGGSGLVGKHLTAALKARGYAVAWLSRKASPGNYVWNPMEGAIDEQAIQWADAIINLAGAGIADARWTASRKKELVESRAKSAETIALSLKKAGKTQIPYLAASAVGFYGDSGEAVMTETSAPADQSFMVQCCQAWEQASAKVAELGNPTTVLRIGVVLDPNQGALLEIKKTMAFGFGAWFGAGQMWMSWIHHHDLCQMFIWALEQGKTGVFNAVAPDVQRNKPFTKLVRDAFHPRAILAPAPAFGLKIALGEMSAVVLNSNRVSSEKVQKAGFQFQFPDLAAALTDLAAKEA